MAAAVGVLIAIVATGIVTVLALGGSHTPKPADVARSGNGNSPGSAAASVTTSSGSAGATSPSLSPATSAPAVISAPPPGRTAFGLADQGEAVAIGQVLSAALPHADTTAADAHADVDVDGHPHAEAHRHAFAAAIDFAAAIGFAAAQVFVPLRPCRTRHGLAVLSPSSCFVLISNYVVRPELYAGPNYG